MTLSISKTPPLRHFLARVGNSTYRFNTILVGLNCVKRQLGDGGAIAVTWTKPDGPARSKQVASQAQSFACAAATILVSDLFDSYLREVADEEWLRFSADVAGVANKSVTRTADQGGAYSVAERAEVLSNDLGIQDPSALALVELFSKWRNVVAHSGDRPPRLDSRHRRVLVDQAQEIAASHSHLRIEMAIRNYEARAIPVAKEVTSLMANAVRLARKIDEAAIRRVASAPDDVEIVVKLLLQRFFASKAGNAKAIVSDMWQGEIVRRENAIVKVLNSLGISNSSKGVSGVLPVDYVANLAALSRSEFEENYLPN